MTTLIVVGAQWGDEGKGKVVDYLASQAQVVARYAGGNNAGHTLVLGARKIVTHLVPSGCAYPGTACVLGAGMVIDPEVFQAEVAELQRAGMLLADELKVSLDAHVILPYHRALDGLREDRARDGAARIGTTRRGHRAGLRGQGGASRRPRAGSARPGAPATSHRAEPGPRRRRAATSRRPADRRRGDPGGRRGLGDLARRQGL
jgi:hypothetical protein